MATCLTCPRWNRRIDGQTGICSLVRAARQDSQVFPCIVLYVLPGRDLPSADLVKEADDFCKYHPDIHPK